jgi:LacI family transcriptional regulator, galactose operon repressor
MVHIRQTDIAKRLNVSRITVSKALRDHPDISPEMKEKVLKVAKKMGYVPNLIATQLNTRKTYTIGIVVPDLENSFFALVVDSIIDFATEKKYHVILTVSREKESIEQQNIENLIGMRVDGLLVCLSQETKDREIFSRVKKMRIPLVFFDRAFEKMDFPIVVFDDKSGALNALDQIIGSGYTRIAHFAGFSSVNIGKRRTDGYKSALRKHRLPVHKNWILEGGFEFKDGYNSFMKLYQQRELPDIIFTVNDRVALGAYKAADECGIKIPSGIGIFGYGFIETTDMFQPPLTVINQDPRKMGQLATALLLDMIDNNITGKPADINIEEEFLWKKSLFRKEKSNKKL